VNQAGKVVVRCPSCGTKNRVDLARVAKGRPTCAKCHAPLELPQRQTEPLTVTDANFEDTVQRSPVPVLMEFWSPYCLYCQRLEPTMRKLAGEVSDRVRVAKLNIDENRITAARYGVHATPTVAMIDQGRLMDKVEGAVPEEQLRYRFHRFLS